MNRPSVFGGGIAPSPASAAARSGSTGRYASPIAAWVDGDADGRARLRLPGRHRPHDPHQDGPRPQLLRHGPNLRHPPTFRFANDERTARSRSSAPATVTVGAKADATFTVTLTIDPTKLRAWTLDSGAQGANADLLSLLEYDGYVWLDDQGTTADDADPAHLPWQVLPRSAASVTLSVRRRVADQRRPGRGPRDVLADGDQPRRSGVVRPGRQPLGRGLQGRRRGDLRRPGELLG